MLKGKKILLVDSDHDARATLIEVLSRERATVLAVETVETVELALHAMMSEEVDVAVCELHLKGLLSGLTILNAMRSEPRTLEVPAIALSSCSKSDEMKKAHAAGFHMYLIKPVDPAALIAAIRHVLSPPRKP